MATRFVSDLHLQRADSPQTQIFLRLLDRLTAADTDALYLLGDLFEVWIGDDDRSTLAARVAERLRRLGERGVPVYFIHGNRDFLLGERYAAAAGMTLLPERQTIDLYGTPTLIMHGDTLCTDDVAYQQYRRRVRDPGWQRRTLALPLPLRRLIAYRLRRKSRRAQRSKSERIMDVNAAAVAAALRGGGARRLVHGHTHRPGRHALTLDGAAAERLVLGAWHDRGDMLVCDAAGWRRETLS